MTGLRRYSPMKPSRGTVIPAKLRGDVRAADGGCVAYLIGDFSDCAGQIELDHVRAASTGGKSPTVKGNLVSLCAAHHRAKTLNGRHWRPLLLDYIAARDGTP